MKKIHTVQDVADWRLCLGCGACAYICPEDRVGLRDVFEEGIRPFVRDGSCGSCSSCLDVCPAYQNDHTQLNTATGLIQELIPQFGPVLEIWEGHAADPEIRFAGSSGGAITALSLFCLEQKAMHGVLHIGQDPDNPLKNKTTMSVSRDELIGKTGSRYSPASACDSLRRIETAPGPCVFVGQPSEVTALRKAQRMRPELDSKIGLAISFFCAGTPAGKGLHEYLKFLGVNLAEVENVRYRGNGWPGMFSVTPNGVSSPTHQKTYQDSWSFIQSYRPLSTHLCPDGTGEDADIACGDPWYREVREGEHGSSHLVVRTERGREVLRRAMEGGYLVLEPSTPQKLLDSQKGLSEKRGSIGGRVFVLKLLGLPVPKLRGFSLFQSWRRLSFQGKLRSTIGTLRRAFTRGYFRPLQLSERVDAIEIGKKLDQDLSKRLKK